MCLPWERIPEVDTFRVVLHDSTAASSSNRGLLHPLLPMKSCLPVFSRALLAAVVFAFHAAGAEPALERLKYHNPGLVVDLGVGLWAFPLPQDLNGDGRLDLAVSCPD